MSYSEAGEKQNYKLSPIAIFYLIWIAVEYNSFIINRLKENNTITAFALVFVLYIICICVDDNGRRVGSRLRRRGPTRAANNCNTFVFTLQ